MTNQRIIEGEELERWKERMCTYTGCPNLSVQGYIYCETHLHGSPQKAPSWVLEKLGIASTKPKNLTANDAVERILPIIRDAFVGATEEYLENLHKNLIGFIASVEEELSKMRGESGRISEEDIDQAIINMEKAFDEVEAK